MLVINAQNYYLMVRVSSVFHIPGLLLMGSNVDQTSVILYQCLSKMELVKSVKITQESKVTERHALQTSVTTGRNFILMEPVIPVHLSPKFPKT